VRKGEHITVRATIGEEIPHPHKKEHHIGWVTVFFRPEGERFPHPLGRTEFSCKETATENQEVDSVYTTHHEVSLGFKPERSGTIFATCMCTQHGVWQGCKDLKVE
jgi:superoxide reductase